VVDSLKGKVALVTGGSSGIGKATARTFAREGAKVVIADIAVEGGKETVSLIEKAGGQAIFVKTDVRKTADVQSVVKKTVQTYGRLDCAFNNAGIVGDGADFIKATEEDWDDVINTNLKGVWLCMKYEIIYMAEHGGGAIVNTSSIGGIGGFVRNLAYGAAKHGVIALTKGAMLEYAHLGIRVNAICPATTRTPMVENLYKDDPKIEASMIARIPVGRMGTPEDMAEAVVWLCSDAAQFIAGHALFVDGGYLAGDYPPPR
jgi:NAD(P)-dependent dehydrogenase (short-subunit alcohol dehydrogenase family)